MLKTGAVINERYEVVGRIGSGGCPGMDDPSRNDVYRMHGIGWGASLSRVNNRSLVMYIG